MSVNLYDWANTLENVYRLRPSCAKDLNMDLNIISKAIKQTNKIAKLCNANLCDDNRKVPIFSKYKEFDELFNEVM